MNKYISACFLGLTAPTAFASLGSGFHFTIGVGGGWVDYQELQTFDLNYEVLYTNILVDGELNEAVLQSFNETAEYTNANENVVGGRVALGYLWDIFEGEPTQIGDAIFQFNATLGLEVGYRLFDDINTSLEQSFFDETREFETFETVNEKFKTQAVDVSAIARLPFTEDNALALLLKGGIAYNIRTVDTSIIIEADSDDPPGPPDRIPYDRTITESENHNEFLPVLGAALEYMMFTNFGVSAEYSTIFNSSHNANNNLISGNIVFRM